MSVLTVLTFPDDRLRTVAKPVEEVTPEIQKFIDDMIETMYQEEGIGLAATQVDFHQRIVVIDISESRDQPMALINPTITERRGEDGIEEGCLSVPGARALVSRASEVSVTALNRDGETFSFEADELLAICVQHELDHLDGKLFVDYLSPLKRKRIKDKLEKIKRFNQRQSK